MSEKARRPLKRALGRLGTNSASLSDMRWPSLLAAGRGLRLDRLQPRPAQWDRGF